MRYIIALNLLLIAGCAGHQLESYDVGITAGQTEFTGETDTNNATTVNGRVNFHFGVKR